MTTTDVPDLERQIIGIAMQSPRDLADLHGVRAEWFADHRCAETWKVIQSMAAEGEPVDPQTIWGHAGSMEPLARVGMSLLWLFDCYQVAPPGHLGGPYTRQLHDRCLRRVTGDALTRAQQLLTGNADVREVRQEVLSALQGVDVDSVGTVDAPTVVDRLIDELEHETPYVPTPWAGINEGIRGWRPGGLYVVAAATSVGKSLVLQQAALDLARRGPVLLETFEMKPTEVMSRLISAKSNVPLWRFQGRLADGTDPLERDWPLVTDTATYISGLDLRFGETSTSTTMDVREHARETSQGRRMAGIVVDYLQLMKSAGKVESRVQEVSGFTRDLKLMAQEFDCPVIVASQLNRESTKGGQRPSLAGLRESGSIEQDADVVILLHELASAVDRNGDMPLDAIVAKNRQGKRGSIPLLRRGKTAQIIDDTSRSIE
jgi:replicative DNA helicase